MRNWVGFPGREPVSLLRDKGPHGYKHLPHQPTNFLSSSCLEWGGGCGQIVFTAKLLSSKRTYSPTLKEKREGQGPPQRGLGMESDAKLEGALSWRSPRGLPGGRDWMLAVPWWVVRIWMDPPRNLSQSMFTGMPILLREQEGAVEGQEEL